MEKLGKSMNNKLAFGLFPNEFLGLVLENRMSYG